MNLVDIVKKLSDVHVPTGTVTVITVAWLYWTLEDGEVLQNKCGLLSCLATLHLCTYVPIGTCISVTVNFSNFSNFSGNEVFFPMLLTLPGLGFLKTH